MKPMFFHFLGDEHHSFGCFNISLSDVFKKSSNPQRIMVDIFASRLSTHASEGHPLSLPPDNDWVTKNDASNSKKGGSIYVANQNSPCGRAFFKC